MSLNGMTNAEKIWNFLISKGLNACGAAGLMGNLYAESGLIPTNLQNTYERSLGMTDAEYTAAVDAGTYTNFAHDSAGYGLAQWTYWSRKEALLKHVKAAKASVGDLEAQLGFLWKELSEGYTSVLTTLKNAASVRQASDAVLTKFERPADQSEAAKKKRASFGQTYFEQYAGAAQAPTQAGAKAGKLRTSAVIAVAVGEIGYIEKKSSSQLDDKTANSGTANYTKYARDFDQKFPAWYNGKKNGFAWCDMFVDWCFLTAFGYENALKLLCQPERSAGAGCTYSLGYYKAKGQLHTSGPKPGDQIFFGKSTSDVDHTGIVEKVDGSKVYTIEGNTSDRVARRSYALTDRSIVGYGRPAYDGESGSSTGGSAGGTSTTPSRPAGSLKVGDIVDFTGTKHFASANATTGPACKPGKAKVTQLYQSGKHPVHLIAEAGGRSTVYGWVDVDDIAGAGGEAWTPKVGDIVTFTGCTHFANANAASGPACKPGKAKITQIYQPGKAKHPYHLVAVSGSGSTVYGWVDEGTFTRA